jgi:hypothetical protein
LHVHVSYVLLLLLFQLTLPLTASRSVPIMVIIN